MLLVHGLSEHSGRYRHVAEFLTRRGVKIFTFDHQGHGRTQGRRGWVANFTDFLDDIETMDRRVRDDGEDLPYLLFGHSMGGLLVTTYLLERQLRPDLLVLSSPLIEPVLGAGSGEIDPSRLSRDPEVWEAYWADPLILRDRVTNDLYFRLAEGLGLLADRAASIDLPVLLIHGTDDKLCGTQAAIDYVDAMSHSDKTRNIYEGGRHEMFNDTNRAEVMDDLWTWLEPRLLAEKSSRPSKKA